MKKQNLIVSFVLLLSLSLLPACGGGTPSSTGSTGSSEPANNDPQQLIIATGGTGGTYYPLGGGMAEQIKKNTGVTATAQTTGASAENVRLIRDKGAEIAFIQSDIADYASKGTNMFAQDGKIDFQAIGALYNETIQIVVAPDSGINTVADLKGKRVSVGSPGSGTEANAQQILEAYGLTFDDLKLQRLSFADSSKSIQDGQLDAAFQTAGTPTAAITELAATKGVKIIPLDADKIDGLITKYPYYIKTTIPGNTYTTVSDEINTVSVKSMLIVRSDLSEDLVYKITKAIYENIANLGHAKAKEIKLEDALKGVNLPIHPGAQKFFTEKGVK